MDIIADFRAQSLVREYMRKAAEEAISTVAEALLKRLKENIIKYTYEFGYYPNIRYEGGRREPSFEFLNSFELGQMKSSAVWISRELFHNWQSMTSDSQTFRHWGSSRFGDSRKRLADILNTTGVSNWGRADKKVRRAFWDATIEEFLEKGLIDKLFDKALEKYGFIRS